MYIFSIDSRDNPFLPGGNLSKEADEILSNATIIRDTFVLREEKEAARKQFFEDISWDDNNQLEDYQSPVKEDTTKQTVSSTENAVVHNASPTKTRPKENGQLDTDNSLTPGSVTIELTDDNKDKKKQKKCCVVM